MASNSHGVDFGGARGSNAGDQFREFWALEQVLRLLEPGTQLTAVTVEGVKSETQNSGGDLPKWSGMDCALYFGDRLLERADAVELVQLKYSAANPESNWTVARAYAAEEYGHGVTAYAGEYVVLRS